MAVTYNSVIEKVIDRTSEKEGGNVLSYVYIGIGVVRIVASLVPNMQTCKHR